MKVTLKNSLLFIAGLFIVMLIVDKLFGYIPAFYSVLIFGVGYLFGDSLGFERGKKTGIQEVNVGIEEEIEHRRNEKKHKKFLNMLNNKTVTILGEAITEESYPKLYQWAKDNPATLEERLQSIAKAWHEGSIASAMQALESDLEHG